MRCDICKIKLCLACSSLHVSDLSKSHFCVPIQIENDKYRMVCDQCSERPSMMHCHLCQVSTCEVCGGIHLFNSSQQHIVVTFPNQNTVVDSQNESRINRLLQCEPCVIQSKELNGGAIRSLSLLSNTEVWTGHWGNDIISLHNLREDKTISITLGHTPEDITVTKIGNLIYTYFKHSTCTSFVDGNLVMSVVQKLMNFWLLWKRTMINKSCALLRLHGETKYSIQLSKSAFILIWRRQIHH